MVQHHDAITGTECSAKEGCAGTDQVLGAHNVLETYEDLVTTTAANANEVVSAVLGKEVGASLTTDLRAAGDLLMGGRPVTPSESRTRNLLLPRLLPADQETDRSHLCR